jgi:hypothetical protein
MPTYWALGTRADGEVVSLDGYGFRFGRIVIERPQRRPAAVLATAAGRRFSW